MAYAGNYLIRSVLSNNTYLSISAVTNGVFAPVVGRVHDERFDPTGPPSWKIVDEGSNTYSILYQGIHPIRMKTERDGLSVYFKGDVQPSKYVIKPVGENLVSFDCCGKLHEDSPSNCRLWTLDGTRNTVLGTPVTLETKEGLTGQHWSLESLD